MYLANDVIQKSNGKYQKAFEPVIGQALISLFETQLSRQSDPSYQDIKMDILKVLNLWI